MGRMEGSEGQTAEGSAPLRTYSGGHPARSGRAIDNRTYGGLWGSNPLTVFYQ